MILHFPNLDAVKLALTSGLVPPAVSLASAFAGISADGQVWIDTSANLSSAVKASLKKLGVALPRTAGVSLDLTLATWLQLFPIEQSAELTVPLEQTPILFVLPSEGLSPLVNEILRLGNDRQSFRFLESKEGGDRVLLRVVGPPYYSLLRAIDSLPVGREGQGLPPVAFVEVGGSKRLWIQVGHHHPLASQIKVPDGQVLLLQPPRLWTFLPEEPFRDIYDVLEFHLPGASHPWKEKEPDRRLQVKLRLERGDATEAAEMWVLRGGPGPDSPLDQLDRFVGASDEDVLRQLAFAVAKQDGETIVVLRARPGKHARPPVLVLQGAIAFRSHLLERNLFVPIGTRLHPKLRRDAIRQLLANNPEDITWLYPTDVAHLAGGFRPETLPDAAFKPLPEWIDYVLDHERQALQEWVKSTQFEFEAFVCSDDVATGPKKPPAEKDRPRREAQGPARDEIENLTREGKRAPTPDSTPPTIAEFQDLGRIEPGEREVELSEREAAFLALEGPLDQPERLALWPRLAELNGSLGHSEEAGSCWANSLWFDPPRAAIQARQWFEAEAARVPVREGGWRWVAEATSGPHRDVAGADLDRVLGMEPVAPADVRALAAYVAWNGLRSGPSPDLLARLVAVRHFLEVHEREAPVRFAWLAWVSLTRFLSGDVLGLARARDRLLARLFEQGLRPEQDLPAFLRFAGAPSSERFREHRDWLLGLPDTAQLWIASLETDRQPLRATEGYSDLIFAFGLARLGEADACRRLMHRAKETLADRDEAHDVLLEAFTYRIEQCLAGKPHRGPLPAEQLEYIQQIAEADKERKSKEQLEQERIVKYCISRLRQDSRILEPDQEIQAQAFMVKSYNFKAAVAEALDAVHDPSQVPAVAFHLFNKPAKGPAGNADRVTVLCEALNVASRVGEEFAVHLLKQATAAYDQLGEPRDTYTLKEYHARLLGKALLVAGHFDRREFIPAFRERLEALLHSRPSEDLVDAVELLVNQSFRGLRKLGLRDEMDHLTRRMSEIVLASQGYASEGDFLNAVDNNSPSLRNKVWIAGLRILLLLAGEHLYLGRDHQAEPVLEAARKLLLGKYLLGPKDPLRPEQIRVACTYIRTLAYLPSAKEAQQRLDELLHALDVNDIYTTATRYKISQLQVLEALVTSVLTDDFAQGSEMRRWLDEDEFLIRRRVHRDVRDALANDAH